MILNLVRFGTKMKLKTCPFCGADGVIDQLENGQFYPRCIGFVSGFCLLRRFPDISNDGFIHIEDAIEVWNRRPKQKRK